MILNIFIALLALYFSINFIILVALIIIGPREEGIISSIKEDWAAYATILLLGVFIALIAPGYDDQGVRKKKNKNKSHD